MHATPACGGQGAPASPPPAPVVVVVVVVALELLLPDGQQSWGQLRQSSPGEQTRSPHMMQTPQSPGQSRQLSP